ncbi:ATP-grasp domain-containing protein [Horticoccus luteus]|uniref:ATP-grasp domain-containing protein n=2 Tax=Horticoccus luteus TaxID=2862869 RepID=A0A8F9TTI1_9BACT|nr:ATP-grasp domain-containing protein [Horticoccus luteus]QYM77509.1 ATP-grasp domain-containing protein [Horticoccus luteus]
MAADLRPELSAACGAADDRFMVPRCLAPDYVPTLLDLCRTERVALLVPTIDTELSVLAEHVAEFAAIGTRVAVSSPAVVAVARDKLQTATTFGAAGVTVPRTALLADMLADPSDWRFPVILKPLGGSSSIGLAVARTPEEARQIGAQRDDYLAQEQWLGREYTVNIFFDARGALRCAVPHWRIETRGGEVSKGRTERVPALEKAAKQIAAALPGARGALCFQAIVNERGEAGVFELNARFGGGYPLAHRAGARFSQWLLEEVAGLPCTANDDWKEGVTMLRYDAAVFV